ncbi:MAG: 50S ribosomal protein L18 [Nitrospira sp.]|nr:50S ribosomal protein L18 [Nitrospira sp.]
MKPVHLKSKQRKRRALAGRNRIRSGSNRPRLSVFRSARHISAQIIDDQAQRTICSFTTQGKNNAVKGSGNMQGAAIVGKGIAARALGKGIKQVSFDRGPYRYHGRVKALADAARQAGLEF